MNTQNHVATRTDAPAPQIVNTPPQLFYMTENGPMPYTGHAHPTPYAGQVAYTPPPPAFAPVIHIQNAATANAGAAAVAAPRMQRGWFGRLVGAIVFSVFALMVIGSIGSAIHKDKAAQTTTQTR